jgi:hypothetical protein
MTWPDRRGRPLKAFLQADIVGADVTIEQVRRQSNNFAVTSPSTPLYDRFQVARAAYNLAHS